jgi:hypothetical protein
MKVIHIEHIGRELNQLDVHQEGASCWIEIKFNQISRPIHKPN